jgi:hypothetical protein
MRLQKVLTVEENWDKNFVRLGNKLQAGRAFLKITINLPGCEVAAGADFRMGH